MQIYAPYTLLEMQLWSFRVGQYPDLLRPLRQAQEAQVEKVKAFGEGPRWDASMYSISFASFVLVSLVSLGIYTHWVDARSGGPVCWLTTGHRGPTSGYCLVYFWLPICISPCVLFVTLCLRNGGFGGFFFVPELHNASQWPFEAVVLLITKVPNHRETLWLSFFKGQIQPWTGESLQQPSKLSM